MGFEQTAEQAAEVDDDIGDCRDIHVLAVHVEDAPHTGRPDIAADEIAFLIGRNDDCACGVACHIGLEHAAGLFFVPFDDAALGGIRIHDGEHFVGLVQLEVVGAFGFDNLPVLDVGALPFGIGVVVVEDESDDD